LHDKNTVKILEEERKMAFNLEYEIQINNLKAEFVSLKKWGLHCVANSVDKLAAETRLNILKADYRRHLSELQKFVISHFKVFDARNVSSLIAIPTQLLNEDERLIHRIWMGGSFPSMAKEAVRQWDMALEEIESNMDMRYDNILWVWDKKQLQGDPLFKPTDGIGNYTIGNYSIGKNVLIVNCLHDLTADFAAANFDFIKKLHAERYFVNLSDFFRLLILLAFGGIYLDADTMPYRSATIFLSKPEVPDYIDFKLDECTGKVRECHVSWMNLFNDENGVLISKKGDLSLKKMVGQMSDNFKEVACNTPKRNYYRAHSKIYASTLHDATYGVWKQEIAYSLLSYDDVGKHYSVLHDRRKETIIGGLRGMRLVVDAITNVEIPLSDEEEHSYNKSINALEKTDWRLDNPLDLEHCAEVLYLDEVPRMAYPPQLRSEIGNCHYYSFLSHDEKLDRMNSLFCAYLMAKNSERIKRGNFWHKTRGTGLQANDYPFTPSSPSADLLDNSQRPSSAVLQRSNDPVHFVLGENMLNEEYKNRMAKLLFSTSYLEYCSIGNKLNLPLVELQKRQNIDQYICYIYGMFDSKHKFAGFFTAGTIAEFDTVKAVSYYRDEMKAMDSAYDEFVSKNTEASEFFIASLAVDYDYRGKGFFNSMLNEIERMAHRKGSRHIVLTVWENSDALQIYLKKGFKIRDTFNYAYDIFFDRLHILEYDIGSKFANSVQDERVIRHTASVS
jgi:GNAT superfamily N-acetyltransferase